MTGKEIFAVGSCSKEFSAGRGGILQAALPSEAFSQDHIGFIQGPTQVQHPDSHKLFPYCATPTATCPASGSSLNTFTIHSKDTQSKSVFLVQQPGGLGIARGAGGLYKKVKDLAHMLDAAHAQKEENYRLAKERPRQQQLQRRRSIEISKYVFELFALLEL